MSVESTCPNCQKRLKAAAGAKVSCPGCKTVFRMPMPDPPAAPAEIPQAILELDSPPLPSAPIGEEAKPVSPADAPAEIHEAVLDLSPPPLPSRPRDDDEPSEPKKRRRRLYDDEIECPECGEVNDENNTRCRDCGYALRGRRRGRGRERESESGLEGLIPYKNAWALWSYYLGVFSLIPCIGIPLGIAALITGIKGLSYAGQNPRAKGKAHAWVGIILGGLCMLGYGGGLILVIIAGMSK